MGSLADEHTVCDAQGMGGCRSLLKNADNSAYSQEQKSLLERRVKFQAEMEKVMGHQTWETHTPESGQERYAELALMRELKLRNASHLADDADKAAMMPLGGLVNHKGEGRCYFVVRVYDAAVLLWPAQQEAVKLWVCDESVCRLEWRCVFDLNEWEDTPLHYASPLHVFIEDLGPYPTYTQKG
jgi:hypothetical protein